MKGRRGTEGFLGDHSHGEEVSPSGRTENGTITGGFAHTQVTLLADKVVDAVKSGAIKRFVVMAGCDGRQKTRGILHRRCEDAAV